MKRFLLILFMLGVALPARAATDIQQLTTPSGINVWLVEEHSIPFVALELRFRGGTSLDTPGKRGAVNLMSALMEEGAGERDAQAFTQRLEELAASFSFNAGDDDFSVSAKFLTETQDETMALLRDALIAPRFDEDALERVRTQVISMLKSDDKDPDKIARKTFYSMAFGDHPYGTNREGSLESISAMARDDMLAAHRAALTLDRVYISAVGDITADQLVEMLDTLLAGIPAAGPQLPTRAPLGLGGGTTVVEFDTPQSVVLFGHEGIRRQDPDFFPAFVMNMILGGGGFESRLMTRLREQEGLTYGVYSYLMQKDQAELFIGSVSSANDKVARAVELVRQEWERAVSDGFSAEEVQDAKTYLTGSYPLRFDGNGPIANILAGMQIDDFPVDYIASRNDKVKAVTVQDVNRVAKRLLQPDALRFVVVGKPEGLQSTQ